MNTTPRPTIASITQPKLKVDNIKHLHDHGLLVEFTEPKLVRLMEELKAARDGKLTLTAGESSIVLEKVGKVLFTTLFLAVGSHTTRNVHYVSSDAPGGAELKYPHNDGSNNSDQYCVLRYTHNDGSNNSDQYCVLRATILGEPLPSIMRPRHGEAQDTARVFIRQNRWAFIGEKGLHTKALVKARELVRANLSRYAHQVGEAKVTKVRFERTDFAAAITEQEGRRAQVFATRRERKLALRNYLATLRNLDVSTNIPEIMPRDYIDKHAVTGEALLAERARASDDQVAASVPPDWLRAGNRYITAEQGEKLATLQGQTDKLHTAIFDAQLWIANIGHHWYFADLPRVPNSYAIRVIQPDNSRADSIASSISHVTIKGRAGKWSHVETLANYTATLDSDEITLSSGIRCPFTASSLLSWLRGEGPAPRTNYGECQRIETRNGEAPVVLVKCGCHYVDVSTLSPEFAEACAPKHVVTHEGYVPDMTLTRETWPTVLARIEAIIVDRLGRDKLEAERVYNETAAEIQRCQTAIDNRADELAKLEAQIAIAETALADEEKTAEEHEKALSYEWRDADAIESFTNTLFSVFETPRFV